MRGFVQSLPRQTKVIFLAWGFSIHAKRRIQLFIDDPQFKVAVVSTHNYNFTNAINILLTDTTGKETSIWKKNFNKISRITNNNLLLRLFKDICKCIKDFRRLKSAVKEFNPDVIFLQTLLYPCYLAYFLPLSLPIMITFWNGDVIWWAKWNGIERMLKKQIVTYGVRRSEAITVNSQMAFNACLRYGSPLEKIHLIRYPGVDLDRFKPLDKDKSKKKLNITSEKIILCPRGLGAYLNSDVIIESVAYVIKKHTNTLFLFLSGVGGEECWKGHLQRAHELGIEKYLRYEGQVSWEMMPVYYCVSDVMVSISLEDSLPNCMLEALACGISVIMGDIPQIRDWVSDGVNGFLVPTKDPLALSQKILSVFEDSEKKIKSFKKKNLELILRKADSRKNIKQVKDLVHLIDRK